MGKGGWIGLRFCDKGTADKELEGGGGVMEVYRCVVYISVQ